MKSLRDYIDLIESTKDSEKIQEWPFSKKSTEGPNVDINNRIFNRPTPKTVASPDSKNFGQQEPNTPPNLDRQSSSDLEHARQFSSAEAYAFDPTINRYMPINNYDPPHVKQAANDEAEQLKNRWIFWRNSGLIK